MDNSIQAAQVQQPHILANERLQSAINAINRNMFELKCYQEKLRMPQSDAERAWGINSAIEYLVSNIYPGLGIDSLADSQAALAMLGAPIT